MASLAGVSMGKMALNLDNIMEAIGSIEEHTAGISFAEFSRDPKKKAIVIRNFRVIGESIKNIPTSLRVRYPDTDWNRVGGFGDLFTETDPGKIATIWNNISSALPDLKVEIRYILSSEESR
jgi:uncharacterized protein with HEPN domain